MATEIMTQGQGWRSRSKRTSVVALGLVAMLAGIAVAYFITNQEYEGNRAIGGTLTVNATLPLDFGGQPLYPTKSADGGEAAVEQIFTITNNNTVAVQYQISATCEECIPDPADTPAEAEARAKKKDQWDHLMVEITSDPPRECPGPPTSIISPGCTTYIYRGHLNAMPPSSPKTLTTGGTTNSNTVAAGESHDWTIKLWLENVDVEQPQGIENLWEFFIGAKTPV